MYRGIRVVLTRTLLPFTLRTANLPPAPTHVSGGLPSGTRSKSTVQGRFGFTRMRADPLAPSALAISCPPWGPGRLAAVNVPFPTWPLSGGVADVLQLTP